MDIHDEIDRSFGAGPRGRPDGELLEDLLGAGHRSVRRRRLATGAAAAAVAVLVGGTAIATTAGHGGASGAPVAGSGGSDSSASPTVGTRGSEPTAPAPTSSAPTLAGVPVTEDPGVAPDEAVRVDPDGLHLAPGLHVTRTLRNPWHVPAPGWSVALVFVQGQKTSWFAGYYDAGGGASAQTPAEHGMSFRDWVAEQSSVRGDEAPSHPSHVDGWPGRTDLQLVRFGGHTERLQPSGAVTILEQRPHPDLPDSWATTRDDSAVAEVRFEGERYYVLARRTTGAPPQYIAVAAAKGGATLDAFLDLARGRYAEGGGGLL